MGSTLTMFLVGFWRLLGSFGVVLQSGFGGCYRGESHHVPGGLLGSFGVIWGSFYGVTMGCILGMFLVGFWGLLGSFWGLV